MCTVQYFQITVSSTLLFLVQTKMSWRTLFIRWYSRQPLGIKVQGCPVLR